MNTTDSGRDYALAAKRMKIYLSACNDLGISALVDADPNYWGPKYTAALPLKEAARQYNDARLRYNEVLRRNGSAPLSDGLPG